MEQIPPGRVIAEWRKDPDKQEFIRQLYYDSDVWSAGLRFFKSEEFKAVLQIAKLHGKLSGHVLDIGGGNGVAALAWSHASYDVTVLEPDASDVVGFGALYPVLELHKLEKLQIYEGVAESTSLPEAQFDIIYCRQVLHHISDLPQLMQEIKRLLKPNGIFIATREHVISKQNDLKAFWENHALHRYTGGEHAYLESEYIEALTSVFSQVRVLRYYDSVINYFPMPPEELNRLIKKELCKVGLLYRLRLCGLAAGIDMFRHWAIKRLNQKNQTPGRMYSFVAWDLQQ